MRNERRIQGHRGQFSRRFVSTAVYNNACFCNTCESEIMRIKCETNAECSELIKSKMFDI